MSDHDKRDDDGKRDERATEAGDTSRERAAEKPGTTGESPTDDDLARDAMSRPGAKPKTRPETTPEDKRLIGAPALMGVGAIAILLLILVFAL